MATSKYFVDDERNLATVQGIINALGDGGFISTNDSSLFEKLKLLRNHGLKNGFRLGLRRILKWIHLN